MTSNFQDLKPSGPDKDGFIPVINIPKVQKNPKEKKKIDDLNKFLASPVTEDEVKQLDQIFFQQYLIKSLLFNNPELTEEFNSIKSNQEEKTKFFKKYYKPMKEYQPILMAMHCFVRYKKKNHKYCIVAVTPHFIIFSPTNIVNLKADDVGNIHVMEIKKLYHGRNYEKIPFLQIRLMSQYIKDTKVKLNATFTNPDFNLIRQLTRIVYRNFSLAYANSLNSDLNFRPELNATIYSDDGKIETSKEIINKIFPPLEKFIKEKLSPSQQFQFTYAANCSHEYVKYSHDVVTYFHNQIINFNGVFDASYIPICNEEGHKRGSLWDMVPIFRSLMYTKYIRGIVCDSVPVPDIFKAVSFQLINSSYLSFLHLSNVNASDGLAEMFANIFYNSQNCGVSYFDFSHNDIAKEIFDMNFEESATDNPLNFPKGVYNSFFRIFKNYKTEVIYLSFNYCNFRAENLCDLFKSMKECPSLFKLKYLHIANSELIDGPIEVETKDFKQTETVDLKKVVGPPESFLYREKNPLIIDSKLLKELEKGPRQSLNEYLTNYHTLVSLDIGDMPEAAKDIEKIMEMLTYQPLECLYLYNDVINEKCFKHLKDLIYKVPLSVLDVSQTGLTADHISLIVDAMSSRPNYRMLTIKANGLRLSGSGTLTILKGFLNGQLDKWDTIYLESNGLRAFDLQLLIPLFQQMVNLRELSLSKNFDSTMAGIDYELCNLLCIPNLKILHIGGSQEHYLGNKIKPFLLSMALSYQIRCEIGGLAIENRQEEQKKFSAEAFKNIDDQLHFKEAGKDVQSRSIDDDNNGQPQFNEDDKDVHKIYLQKKFDSIIKPFLLEKSKRNFDKAEKWRNIFEMLIPLIKKCRSIYQYQRSDTKKKTIADFTMDILTRWTSKIPINSSIVDMKDTILNSCEAEDKMDWINTAANLAHLKYLDIKEVKVDLDVVSELLKIDRELRGVEIDGCGIKTIGSVVDFVETVENQPNLIKIPFPNQDMVNLTNAVRQQCGEDAWQIADNDLRKLRLRMMRAINNHRFAIRDKDDSCGEVPAYPFEEIKQITNFKNDKNDQNDQRDELPKEKLRKHSGISEDLHMQLPYIPLKGGVFNGLPDDYYLENDEEFKDMSAYQFFPLSLDKKKNAEKSIAIQKTFYEIEPEEEEKAKDAAPSAEKSDDNEPVDVIDLKQMSRNVKPNLKFFQSDHLSEFNLRPMSESSEESSNEGDGQDLSSFDVPAFNPSGSKKKPKLYGRKKKDINFSDTNSDSSDDLNSYRKKFKDLKGEVRVSEGEDDASNYKPPNGILEMPP